MHLHCILGEKFHCTWSFFSLLLRPFVQMTWMEKITEQLLLVFLRKMLWNYFIVYVGRQGRHLNYDVPSLNWNEHFLELFLGQKTQVKEIHASNAKKTKKQSDKKLLEKIEKMSFFCNRNGNYKSKFVPNFHQNT